jgi:hypothetical protein
LVGTNVLGYFNNAGLSGQDWIRLIE